MAGSVGLENENKEMDTVIIGNHTAMEKHDEEAAKTNTSFKTALSNLLWHGGSTYDAWFSCASNQVAQVLLTLPYSFSQLGMLSGILFQLFYGLLGSWTAYLISVLYVEYRARKEREKVDFRNHVIQWFEVLDGLLGRYWRNVGLAFNCTFLLFGSVIQLIACARIWSFLGLVMTTYTAWYLTIASLLHGQGDHACNVEATEVQGNLFTGNPVCVDIDSAISIGNFITFGFACTPLYFVWEKLIGMHDCKSICKRAAARLPVVIPIWFFAIIFPFFGPINSAVGSLLVSFTVYIIPALAHMFTFRSPAARENAVEQPPKFMGRWAGTYALNMFVVVWVFVVGFGFGGWASMVNFVRQIDTFGLFAKCYQCPPPHPHLLNATAPPPSHPTLNHTPHL
ncbi:hypothetical protein Cgig2_014757 [Carnegiea gigantea]|uniref:Amino acid transporter transmembrane domain-containing protein n=1 Tax=Carnegiea gigantea TaxID=171969 RepID=A0A9Q1L1X2_9CARY|nr:hypothetical protein Cgig2_014757 [Carnegiea gigantea]